MQGGEGSKKSYPQIEQFLHYLNKCNENIFLTQGSNLFPSVVSKFFFLPVWFKKKDSGDVHKFCTTLMEKTVGEIGILNSDLFSDQFFFSVASSLHLCCCCEWADWLEWETVDAGNPCSPSGLSSSARSSFLDWQYFFYSMPVLLLFYCAALFQLGAVSN